MQSFHLMQRKQAGFSLLGLSVWIAIGGVILLSGMKTAPIINEYLTIKQAITKSRNAGSESDIKRAFDIALSASYVSGFSSTDLVFQTAGNRNTVGFAYERRIHLTGPVSVLFEFSDNQYIP